MYAPHFIELVRVCVRRPTLARALAGHLGEDDKLYLLDFARLYPPGEIPPQTNRVDTEVLYCL
jgi:hypothetical protein